MTVSNDYPVQSEQNTTLMETFIAQKKKKQAAKHNWIRLVLKLCELEMKISSVAFSLNIYLLFLFWEFSPANDKVPWFVSWTKSTYILWALYHTIDPPW